MKRLLVWFFVLTVSLMAARAQDAATQQQIDELRGQLQTILETQSLHTKQLNALAKEISELRDRSGGSGASQEDLQKLADQLQEIDKKRQEDRELILKEIEKIAKVGGGSSSSHKPSAVSTAVTESRGAAGAGPQKGYEYAIQRGDTLSAIVRAYGDQGIKVTTDQILKANPGLDPKNLVIGKKIFIPAPGQ